MTEEAQPPNWLRDAEAIPMCTCFHLFLNYVKAVHTNTRWPSVKQGYFGLFCPQRAEVKGAFRLTIKKLHDQNTVLQICDHKR